MILSLSSLKEALNEPKTKLTSKQSNFLQAPNFFLMFDKEKTSLFIRKEMFFASDLSLLDLLAEQVQVFCCKIFKRIYIVWN